MPTVLGFLFRFGQDSQSLPLAERREPEASVRQQHDKAMLEFDLGNVGMQQQQR